MRWEKEVREVEIIAGKNSVRATKTGCFPAFVIYFEQCIGIQAIDYRV